MDRDEFRSYLRKNVMGNFVFNWVLNSALAFWLLREHATLLAWGDAGYGPDLMLMGFLLSVLLTAIVMEIHRRKAAGGQMEAVALASPLLRGAAAQSRWLTWLAVGVLGALSSGLVAGGVAAGTGALSLSTYALLKGAWAGLLAALLVGPAIVLGLHLGAAERPAG